MAIALHNDGICALGTGDSSPHSRGNSSYPMRSLRIGSGSSSEQMKRCVFWLTSPRDDTRMLPPGRPIFPVIDVRIDVARQTCTLSCIWSSARPRIRQADFACA